MAQRSIQDVAGITGVTSRTLRHYDAIGLLPPTRVAAGGVRWYDDEALVRLQRILLLRALGLGLPAIQQVLDGRRDDLAALRIHADALRAERDLLDRRIRAVETTVRRRQRGEELMAEESFDGFDHREYREEVEARWGSDAWRDSDAWWRSKSPAERAEWQKRQRGLAADWADAARRGLEPASEEAQGLARRHVDWLTAIPGTPGYPDGPSPRYLAGLADMYVADPRFAANYDGGAEFVRDALHVYVERLQPGDPRGEVSAG
ncbi:MAG: MerR family transcriptional regulator [Micrococcales bacterium]|nr:MerR family transcriptional regulator [Micrococcales bacterium]